MAKAVRVGIIGTSGYTAFMHVQSLKSHPAAQVVAICGRNRDRAAELATEHAIPLVFTDYHEMIEHGNLHALVIATPDDLHYAMTMDALGAGLHVVCEKPLALTAVQAKAMYEKAEAVGVKHMTHFTYRWSPYFRYLKALIDAGYLGRCYHCFMRYEGGGGRDPHYEWRFDRHHSNGVLGDLGSHLIDLARWYVGDIAKVSAHLTTFVEQPGLHGQRLDPAADSAVLTVAFVAGAQGTFQVSYVTHVGDRGQEFEIVLHGEAGSLELDFTWTGAELRALRHGEEQWHTLPVPAALWGNADPTAAFPFQCMAPFFSQPVGDRAFIDAILADGPLAPTFYDGYKAQVVVDAALAAAAQGGWIAVP